MGYVNLRDVYDCNVIFHIGNYFIQFCEQTEIDESEDHHHLLIQTNCLTKSMTMWTASFMESELEKRDSFEWD